MKYHLNQIAGCVKSTTEHFGLFIFVTDSIIAFQTGSSMWLKWSGTRTGECLHVVDSAIMLKKTKRIKPADEAKSYILSSCDKPGFVERFINKNKGRGVIATQPVESGDFVLVYRGELLVAEECWARHYTELQTTFLFEFDWQGSSWCIDASKEDGTLGRLCNDNHKSPNCTMKKIVVNNRPHLCLFAVKKIEIGNEIEYNYGDAQWPWRKKGPEKNASVSQSIVSSHVMESFQDGPITQGPENNASVSQSIVSSHVMESFQDGPITQRLWT
ncbi:N-lysine methyltransferase KMT5A-like isoform X2 [Triplophysa rosa]|uniref:N-lysine methyltransferase KMT5A-like isoform X2 n=1 Tax=Triplophysa rosa TaxID=992332 RepID=UPI0025460D42|nr:N-lysine methyltransferase KMT5A-like isoform X2 [Triplophysa rosa]